MGALFSSPISSSASSLIFPSPVCSYDDDWRNFIKIKKPKPTGYLSSVCSSKPSEQPDQFIPAFFFRKNGIKTTIIYSHGNSEDIGHCYSWMESLHESLDVNVIAYDYEGYGLHEGSSNENSCYRDIDCVFEYLLENGIDEQDIIVYGRSLGTGPSVELASIHNLKGVILESPYTSIFGVVSNIMSNLSFCIDPFRNESKIHKIKSPIIIFHGTDDTVIPYEHSISLQQKSNCRLYTLNGGGHNDLQSNFGGSMLEKIKTIL